MDKLEEKNEWQCWRAFVYEHNDQANNMKRTSLNVLERAHLQCMVFQAQNVLIRVAQLSKLQQGVLQPAGNGNGMAEGGWIISELSLVMANIHTNYWSCHLTCLKGGYSIILT